MRYCRNIVFLICALRFIPLQSTHGHIILRGGTEQNEDKSNRFLAGLDAKGDRYEPDKPKINFSTKIGKNENSTEPAEYASAYYVTIREIH